MYERPKAAQGRHNKTHFRIIDFNSGSILHHTVSAEERDSAELRIVHDDAVGINVRHTLYPGDYHSYIASTERGGTKFNIGLSVFLYNPDLGQMIDDKMRRSVDVVICNKESKPKIRP